MEWVGYWARRAGHSWLLGMKTQCMRTKSSKAGSVWGKALISRSSNQKIIQHTPDTLLYFIIQNKTLLRKFKNTLKTHSTLKGNKSNWTSVLFCIK